MTHFSHPGHARAPRGVAILMVLAVLAALIAISTPFVFSMIQHGRSARNDVNQQVAREGAEAAEQHALAERLRIDKAYFGDHTIDDLGVILPLEVTTQRDLIIDMGLPFSDSMVTKYKLDTNVQNPRGMLWSAKVEDEQGKINVNTAPPALLGNLLASALLTEGIKRGETQLLVDDCSAFNPGGGLVCMNGEPAPLHYSSAGGGSIQLEQGVAYAHMPGSLVYDGRARLICNALMPGGMVFAPFRSVYEIKMAAEMTGANALPPEDFARIERHLTVENGMGSPLWGHGERLGDSSSTGAITGVGLKNGQGFSPGTLVRITTNGDPTGFGRVRTSFMKDDGSATVEFEKIIGGSSKDDGSSIVGGTYVEPQMKNPVNINTASDEVLAAVFTGVCLRNNKYAVPHSAAVALVDFLRGRAAGSIGTAAPSRRIFNTNEDVRKAIYRAHEAGIVTLPQRDALAINAMEPNSSRLSLSTVPFCFFSHGSYTIEGSGVANSDNGMQLARHTQRQLVTLPTLLPGRYRVQYQAGFQELIDQGMSSRVVTYPTILGKHRFKQGAPLDRFPKVDMGNVRLDVGESGSMVGLQSVMYEWFKHCDDETDARYKQEGYDITRGAAFTVDQQNGQGPNGGNPRGAGFRGQATPATSCELWFRPKGNGQCTFYDEGLQDDRNRVMFSYDPGEGGLVIRVWDSTLPNDKFKHVVEFVYPISLKSGDWYHIAGSWKTSHPGGQEIRVDAMPYPNGDPKQMNLLQFKPGGRLGGDLGLTSDPTETITLQDGDGKDFPKAGAIKIGEEIIEYTQNSGGAFSGVYRGARMSAAIKHKSGEWVIPYGYVNHPAQDLVVGKATLVDDFPMASKTHTKIQFPPNAKPNFVLSTAVDKIPVEDASDFPAAGFVTIEGECIYYGAKKKGANNAWELNKLQRAQNSAGVTAPARNLHDGQGVSLCSVAISNSTDYDIPGIVQLDDENNSKKVEWVYYSDKRDMDGKHFLEAELANGNPATIQINNPETPKPNQPNVHINRFRHVYGIGDYLYLGTQKGVTSSHAKKAKVIPVVRMNAPHCGGWDPSAVGDPNAVPPAGAPPANPANPAANANVALIHDSPYGEEGVSEVSIVEQGKQDGDLRWVKQAYLHQYSNTNNQPCPRLAFTGWSFDYYVGLNDFVSRRYPAGTTRYLHWPTGELPDALGATPHVCEDKNGEGKVNGDVDEVRVNTFRSLGGRIAMNLDGKGLEAGDEEILVENYDAWPTPGGGGGQNPQGNNNPLNWPSTGGLARIEDELIYYTSVGTGQVQYYADTFPPLMNKPPELNKADRRWVNPCTTVHELHVNIVNKNVSRLMKVKRGALNTKPVEHPVGAQIMLLDAMAVSHLTGAVSGMVDSFQVASGAGFPLEGYAWINDEVLSWTKGQGTSFNGIRYFRGRFGTEVGEHEVNDIVRCLPFRYWDRDTRAFDGEGLAFIQSGYRASNASWYGLEFDLAGTEEQPQVPQNVVPHVLVRFDGKPAWDTDVTNKNGGLYEYQGKKALKLNGREGIAADQMEVRVFWKYLRGAFNNGKGADWKHTFSLEKLRARYDSPLIMRRLDEVEKR